MKLDPSKYHIETDARKLVSPHQDNKPQVAKKDIEMLREIIKESNRKLYFPISESYKLMIP